MKGFWTEIYSLFKILKHNFINFPHHYFKKHVKTCLQNPVHPIGCCWGGLSLRPWFLWILYLINLPNMPHKALFSHFKTFQSWVRYNPSPPPSPQIWLLGLQQKDHKSSSASVRQDKKIIREIAFQKLMIWAKFYIF